MLNQFAVFQNADTVAEGQRLFLIVGDENRRDADLALDAFQFDLHVQPQCLVERAERFVQQQHARPRHDGAGQRDTLPLPAGELMRPPVAEIAELHQIERLADPFLFFRRRNLPHPKTEADIVGDAHVRKQGVVLEHHADFALFHRHVLDRPVADPHRALVGEDETGNRPQQGRLAAARRPQQPEELTVRKGQRYVVERRQRAEPFCQIVYLYLRHQRSPPNFEYRATSNISTIDTVMMMVEIALISGVKPLRIAE